MNAEAKTIITELPAEARDNAAGVWVQGSQIVMGVLRTLCSQTTLISGRVGELEKGQFWILTKADEKMRDTADAGIHSILGPSMDAFDGAGD